MNPSERFLAEDAACRGGHVGGPRHVVVVNGQNTYIKDYDEGTVTMITVNGEVVTRPMTGP